MEYVLGLDVGISSVGWCVLNLDRERIEDLGVRAFSAAEVPKTRGPLAEARRVFRGTRRRLRRRAGRLRRARELFSQHGLIPEHRIDATLATVPDGATPWELRSAGLDRPLTGEEFARALYHLVKRRGFKSNRKKDRTGEDEESRKVLGCIEANRQRLIDGNYRTAGEMYWKDSAFQDRKRNSTGFYGFSVDRGLLEAEIQTLFRRQREHGNSLATPDFENGLVEVFRWQMPFARGDQLLKLVGPCSFEPEEKRAPKACFTTERCNLLQHINRLTITDGGSERRLTPEERFIVGHMPYELATVSYAQLRKKLNLPDSARFKGLTYARRQEGELIEDQACEKALFARLQGYHGLKKPMEAAGLWESVRQDADIMDKLAFALTFYKTDEDIRANLESQGVPAEVIQAAETAPQFSKVGHLSIKAMRRMIPHLEQGFLYSEACAAAGYNHSESGATGMGDKLPVIDPDEVRNPVVLRALSQTRKVVNAVIRKHGMPCRVHVELAREVGKSPEQRNEVSKRIEQGRAEKQKDRERFEDDFKRAASVDDLIKYRLYREQNGQCAYTGKALDVERLFDPGYAEVDHILPYSRSFDDSLNNRVLVLAIGNQEKRDRTPHEWLGHDAARWEVFEAWVHANIRHPRKRANLLAKDYEKRQSDWMQRNLNDTQYIARFLATYIRSNLKLGDPTNKAPVMCLNGRVTAMARGLWGLKKVREENDLHHAADAAVIAAMTPGQVKRITVYHQALENGRVATSLDRETGEISEYLRGRKFMFPLPWDGFRDELKARLSDDPSAAIAGLKLGSYAASPPPLKPVTVSRMPCRKVGGALHAETIRAARVVDGQRVSVVRRALTSLTATDLNNLCDESGLLKRALQVRLAEYDGKAAKAFAEPFYWPRKPGQEPRLVKAVRVSQVQPSGIEVREGIADNGDMVRVDVFRRDGKYWIVPVYTAHVAAGVLPDKAIVAFKPEAEWQEMTGDFEFLFTLQPYDLVRIETAREAFTGYYRGTHRGTGNITLSDPNRNLTEEVFGPRRAGLLQKLGVTILGDTYKIGKEKRRGVANGRNNQSREPPG